MNGKMWQGTRQELHRDAAARRAARSRASRALALAALLACAPALEAQGGRLVGFEKTGDFLVELDGVPADSVSVYKSTSAGALLVSGGDLAAPVLIRPRTRSVEKISLLKIAENPNGTLELLPNPAYGSEPPFQVDELDVVFQVEGRNVRLKPKPALLGFQNALGIYAHSPEYEVRKTAYATDDGVLGKLRAEGRDVRVQVFFGTWCPACGQMVPRILKVAEEMRGSKIQFAYYGLDRQFSGDSEAKRLGIKSVPTGVVWVDGVEVGRISGNGWRSPEAALRDLLGS